MKQRFKNFARLALLTASLAIAHESLVIPASAAPAPFGPFLMNFTNTVITSITNSMHATNAVHALTNGTMMVTSAPVALYRGRGAALWFTFTPTNALLTNLCLQFDFSPDGTNWSGFVTGPTLKWTVGPVPATSTAGFAANTSVTIGTNLLADVCDNFKYIRLNQISITNGLNTVGNIFFTNRPSVLVPPPTIGVAVFP